ncbi:TetR family transcriptional regulator [Novosphingobium resinovorum]|uniref:TetR family transcriptional regulator n=1 Tax=Novosphingobium resinovorum TaxID=158500 RepID=A0A031K428_9SPHN|nr:MULTISPECIES: TetR/AcrR family transcriptional regulator [Novosphingobium]EZP83969.1 TetR family transcriptional regulator [Novosphingobium resinovorum]
MDSVLARPAASASDQSSASRRRAFVAAATSAFFAQGYAGTAMSEIARAVGGSKTTLWAYFPSKEELFAAVVDDIVERYGKSLSVEVSLDDPVETVLRRFAEALISTIYSAPVMALHRLVISEAERFPYLAELFYERGPRRGKQRLADYLEAVMARGDLQAGQPMLAVRQFSALCQAGGYEQALLKLDLPDSERSLSQDVEIAIEAFLRIWRPNAAPTRD